MLDDPEWVSRASIKALAARAHVSEPTIIRLVRKLGCAGFTDFKLRLAEDLVVTRMFMHADAVVEDSAPSSIADRVADATARTLREARNGLDHAQLDIAASKVAGARRLMCFGVGGSSAALAAEAENRFFRLGLAASATADPYKQVMAAAIADASDVLLCLSSTGKPDSLIESTRTARARGATVIVIAPAQSPLATEASLVLPVAVFSDELYFNLPSPTRYAQLFMLDCLAASVAVKVGSPAVNNLKAIRQALSRRHGPFRFQPIGD